MLPIKSASILIVLQSSPDGLSFWTQQRTEEGPIKGLFEFPGGKLEEGETSFQALLREFEEEVGIKCDEQIKFFSEYMVNVSDKKINLNVFICESSKEFWDRLCENGRIFTVKSVEDISHLHSCIPETNIQIIGDLVKFHLDITY